MTIEEMQIILTRWQNLYDVRYSVSQLDLKVSNPEAFLKEIINTKTFNEANDILVEIEKIDQNFKTECERRKVEEETKKLEQDIKLALNETTWSMLSDAPLSQEGKKLYRDYRQYLRDIPDLWKRQQINELKVMTFDEWRKNPPIYKVEKKVIL